MARFDIQFAPSFSRDLKKMAKRHVDVSLLSEVIELIANNDESSKDELRRRHRMHALKGDWEGSMECHVCNLGDWLLVWPQKNGIALLVRTGRHDEVFRKTR